MPRVQLRCLPGEGSPRPGSPQEELDALYREHADFVWRTARQLGAPPQDLDDIVHDTFLIAYRRWAAYDPNRPWRAWLFGITRNLVRRCRTGIERERRRLRAVPRPSSDADLDAAIEHAEARALLQSFLDGLPEGQRLVFALLEVEGMNAPEVAEILGLKLNTVYSRLRLTRRRFERFVARRRAVMERHG